ncbi:MAG: hypothetical protein J6R82_03210 [Clostridia bacterium]|nr:hypothetical protein [Clostridia bacterium]
MKKYLSLLLVLIFCLGCFVGCNSEDTTEPTEATLDDAVTYLQTLYKDGPVNTPRSYDMPGKVMIGTTAFTVTWTVSIDAIKVVESPKAGFWTITLPEKNETEQKYTLTATVKDADGKTKDVTFNRVMPVMENTSTANPEADKEYKLFMTQVNVGKVLYAIAETQDDKYLKSTDDPAKAAIFKTEEVEGGVKMYTMIDGVKSYIYAHTVPYEDGSGKMSKYLCYSTENASVFTYQQKVNAWFTTCADGTTYVMGTYSSFETFCISESSYITEANTGVTQYPAELLENGKAAPELPKDENKDPAADSTLTVKEALELGATKISDQYTSGKYYVTGVITEVYNEQYGNMKIADSEGNILTVYGTYGADGSVRYDALETKPVAGDTVKVYGIIGQYKDVPQMKNGWIVEHTPAGQQPETPDTPDTPVAPVGATQLTGKLENGMKIVIVNGANKKAFSSDPATAGSFYQKGVDVTITGNTVTGYGAAEIWTVVANDDGSFSFEQGGQKIGMQDSYSSMSLGSVNDKWTVTAVEGGYNITNTVRGNTIEWYADKDNWSTYHPDDIATNPLFVQSIYVVK